MINKDNKVFIPDAEYSLSRINKIAAIEAFIDGVMLMQFIVLCIVHSKGWFASLSTALQIIVIILVGVAAILLLLVMPVVAGFLAKYKHGSFSNVVGRTKLAIIDNNVYEFDIERVTGDKRESLDIGKIKEIIDKAGNKQTAKDWIIENILKAIGPEKSVNVADMSIPLPGETTVDTDENSEHLELAVNKCEILVIKKSEHEDSIEVVYRYDFVDEDNDEDDEDEEDMDDEDMDDEDMDDEDDDDDDEDDEDMDDEDDDVDNNEPDGIIKYKPKNFIRFADGSLSGYKELVDSLESIQKQKEQVK